MSNNKNPNFSEQMGAAFSKHRSEIANFQKHLKGKRPASTRDLELALAVLLVELASCDQNFDQNEYELIAAGLKSVLGTDRTDVSALINQANLALADLRGTSSYGELLKEHLKESDRLAILEIVDGIINSDGKVDGYELYVRGKIARTLGVSLTPKEGEKKLQ